MTTSADIDQMIADLKAAGWVAKTSVIWRSPEGKLYLGPAGAWHVMRERQKTPARQMLFEGCFVERLEMSHSNRTVLVVGDDLHMNGLDAPATIRSRAEAEQLIAWLRNQLEHW